MAVKNLKVIMSGDTKPYRQEIDKAAVATASMKKDIRGHLDGLAGLFGTSLGTIGQSFEKVAMMAAGLTASFATAAAGGEAFSAASTQVTAASNAVAQAEARAAAAGAALAAVIGTGVAEAEALAIAEAEVLAATVALSSAQGSQAIAQQAVNAATTLGTKAMAILKIAMISTGIGALVVVVGSLVAYFSQTREGANKIKVVLAELGAIVRTLKDHFSSLGESIWKFITLDFKGAAEAMGKAVSGIGTDLVRNAAAAGEFAKQTQALNKAERENMVLQQERLTKAMQLRATAKEEGVAAADKKKMLREASELYKQYYEEEKHISAGRRDIAVAEAKEYKLMGDELKELEEKKVKVLQVDQEAAEVQKSLAREMKGANRELIAQAAAITAKALAQRKANAEGLIISGGHAVGLKAHAETLKETLPDEDKTLTAKQKEQQKKDDRDFALNLQKSQALRDEQWRKEQKNIKDTKTVTLDLTSSINDGLSNLGVGVGAFLGDLISGEGGIKNFGTMVAGVFADMAIQVGQVAIKTGVASLAIFAALKGHPYLAIAAGIALVALGTAMKGKMASIASGGASGSMSSGSAGDYNFDTRNNQTTPTVQRIAVTVNGQLNATAKGLGLTLSRENTRVSIVT